MGCDIHPYLEFSNPDAETFCLSGEISLGRCYTLFNIMAGVRGFDHPLFIPRGIPHTPKISRKVESNYYLYIADPTPSQDGCGSYRRDRTIDPKEASKLVNENKALYYDNKRYITDPTWHTASWLSKNELIQVRKKYLLETLNFDATEYTGRKRADAIKKIEEADAYELMKYTFPTIENVALNATIGSMIAIENSGDYTARLVFWFDS